MNRNVSPIRQQSSLRRKRKVQVQPVNYVKKLRSKIPRRKRFHISPILSGSVNSLNETTEFSAFPAASSSSSCFPEEISCTSNWISVRSENLKKPRSFRRKRDTEEISGFGAPIHATVQSSRQLEKISDAECQRKTRSYYRQKESEREVVKKSKGDLGVELSESSCVESFSGAEAGFFSKSNEFSERNLKWKARARKIGQKEEESEGNAASAAVSLSEVSCIQSSFQEDSRNLCKSYEFSKKTWHPRAENSNEIQENEISKINILESLSKATDPNLCPSIDDLTEKTTKDERNRAPEASFSEISQNNMDSNLVVVNSASTVDKKPKDFKFDSVLACSEHLSYDEDSEYSSSHEMTLSELESEIFPKNSDLEFSDYTPSVLLESPSDFSERTAGNSTPSVSFSLLLQYTKQLTKLSSPPDIEVPAQVQDEYFEEFTFLRFEDEEHEESYKKFRGRERRQVVLHNYAEEYCSTTDYGELVLQQRLLMVNWIVEESNAKEFQCETMFLAVSLLDRFLSHGFFKNKRKLQVLGIACLTLATRIEENQPFNSVRQKTVHVGSNVYSRCEVVGMEWLVQEILKFQCFWPTTYNFLWFYLKAARADAEVEKMAKYLATISLLDHGRLCYWPSTVAAGLVILASLAANQDDSCERIMETHVRTKNDDLPECIQSLEWLVKYVC